MIFFRKIVLEDGRARGGFWTVFGWQKFLYQYYYYLFFFLSMMITFFWMDEFLVFVINVFGLRFEDSSSYTFNRHSFFSIVQKMTSLIFFFFLTFLNLSVLECIELFFFRRWRETFFVGIIFFFFALFSREFRFIVSWPLFVGTKWIFLNLRIRMLEKCSRDGWWY